VNSEERADLDEIVFRAMHSIEGARGRWAQRRARGLDDAELRAAIVEEFGIAGGFSWPQGGGGADIYVDVTGGLRPRLAWRGFDRPPPPWRGEWDPTPDRIIQGAELLALVRRVLEVPCPPTAQTVMALDIEGERE